MAEPRGSIFSLLPDYNSPLGDWEAAARLQAEQKGLSIKYLNCSVDEDMFYLHFEVAAKNLINGIAWIFVIESEVFSDEDVVPKRGVNIQPNSTAKVTLSFSKKLVLTQSVFEGEFEYMATITCDGLSAQTDEFRIQCLPKTDEEKGCDMKDPVPVTAKPLALTDKQKAQFIAVCMGESANGERRLWDVVWVYFNLVNSRGFERGLKRSAFYNARNNKGSHTADSYKLFMYSLGQGAEYSNHKMVNGNLIEDWVLTDDYINGAGKNLDLYKRYVDGFVFNDKPVNLFPGWYGQGYWRDLNLPKAKDNGKWYQARVYFRLQEDCEVNFKYVQELEAGYPTTYIFDEISIAKYFEKNPDKLPKDESSVRKFFKEKN